MRITKTILIALIAFCILLYACKRTADDNNIDNQYVIEKMEFDISKSIMLEDLDSIEVKDIIKLGADSTMPLGTIDKVIVTKDRLFVLDKTFSKFLFVYDRQGDFLWKIGYKGRGEGEYLNGPIDFVVDESIKNIDVFESEIKTIFTYDWDGELIHTKVLEETWPYSFTKSDSIFYFAYNTVDKDGYLLRIEDEKENPLFKYKPLNKIRELVSDHSFFTTPQNIYFVEDYNNDVFVLRNNGIGIEKILSFDFGDNSIEKDFLTKYKGKEFIKTALANEKATKIAEIVETDELFAFQIMNHKTKFQIIQNKDSGKYLTGISWNIGLFPNLIHTNYDNYLVSSMSAEHIEFLCALKDSDPNGWNELINSAHPEIKNILLSSGGGKSSDYIFIYDLKV